MALIVVLLLLLLMVAAVTLAVLVLVVLQDILQVVVVVDGDVAASAGAGEIGCERVDERINGSDSDGSDVWDGLRCGLATGDE